MRRRLIAMTCLLPLAGPVFAQPADCVTDPPATATVPLSLDLQGLPGVPSGLTGLLGADVPVAPPGGTYCAAPPPPPSDGDVLAGPPGDVLHGRHARDLLRGNVPRVEVETR